MKITHSDANRAPSTLATGSTAGGDLGGTLPAPTVVGIGGIPVDVSGADDGDALIYDAATGEIVFGTSSPALNVEETDGSPDVANVSVINVPPNSLVDNGSGDIDLKWVTPEYGGEETINTVAASGTTETLNPSAGNIHDVTLTANCTISLGSALSGRGCALTVILRQDGTGSRLVTWPGSVTWVAGSAPVLKTAASAIDVVVLFTLDGGTTWGGTQVGSGTLDPDDVRDAGRWEVVMTPGVVSPPEPVWTPAGDDYVYAWVT